MNDAQYQWLITIVGAGTTREQADAAYVRLGTPKAVALEILTARHAQMTSSPIAVTIPGVVSVNFGENLKALERLITQVQSGPDDPTGGTTTGDTDVLELIPMQSSWARRPQRRGRPIWTH